MTKLVLIRGLPGSGKSTMAKTLYKDLVHVEADMFYIDNGVYKFDAKKISSVHWWCQTKTLMNLINEKSVVVSNTFVKAWELQPYIKMAEELMIDIEIITATGNYSNIHGVPQTTIDRMENNWEEFELG